MIPLFRLRQNFPPFFFAFSLRFKSTAPEDLLKGRGLNVVLAKVRQRHGEGSLQRCRTFDQLVDPHEKFSGCKEEVQNGRSIVSPKPRWYFTKSAIVFNQKHDSISRNWRHLLSIHKQMIMFCLLDFAFVKCLKCNKNRTLFVFKA